MWTSYKTYNVCYDSHTHTHTPETHSPAAQRDSSLRVKQRSFQQKDIQWVRRMTDGSREASGVPDGTSQSRTFAGEMICPSIGA